MFARIVAEAAGDSECWLIRGWLFQGLHYVSSMREGQKLNIAAEYCYAPVNYMSGAGIQAVEVSIVNGRQAQCLEWQANGFELVEHHSSVTDWDNAAQVRTVHYPEMAALAKTLSGADHALISSHICRNPEQADLHDDYAPIQYVHSDFADDYGQRIMQLYQQGNADTEAALTAAGLSADDVLRAKRLLILQFWRNVGPATPDLPIAFVDAQSVPRADVHQVHVPNYAGGDFAFDTLGVTPPPTGHEHHWYVFPNMQVDEVVVFRTFDSAMAAAGEPYWTPHSAFEDPHAGIAAPPRRSIEVRATCLFK